MFLGSSCHLEVGRLHFDVVGRWVMLGKVLGKILTAGLPVDAKLTLSGTVADPIKAHIHGLGTPDFDQVIGYAVGHRVISLDGGGTLLWVAHFLQCVSDDTAFLARSEEATNLGFCSRGYHIPEEFAEDMDGAIWLWWRTVGIRIVFVSKKEVGCDP